VEGDVLHDLDEDAAQAEHQHRAELRVARHAEDDFAAAGAHAFDVDAVDAGGRGRAADAHHHEVEGVAHRVGGAEVELDARRCRTCG
jgi:hypothetical protein